MHIAGFYRYAVEEDLLDRSPAAHVRRPRLDYESHAIGLDRNELGAMLVAAVLGTAAEHALISLLALSGLRVSEAAGASIEALGTERGHRTLTITRKGGKVVTLPLAPRTARAIDLAVGERCEGPRWTGSARARRSGCASWSPPIPTLPLPRSQKLTAGVSRRDSGGCQSSGSGNRAAATCPSGTTRSSAGG
ncbi:MAG TPA: hypothetical protein VLW50_12500 [Streptosporangiaceae bacterium]|nr:hypothetical protein [Streptosporangiaceae bacterium]